MNLLAPRMACRQGKESLATAGTAPPGTGPPRAPRLKGTLPPAERARQAKSSGFFRILGEGGARQGRPPPRPRLDRLEKKGIGDGEVIKDRIVGPLGRHALAKPVHGVAQRREIGCRGSGGATSCPGTNIPATTSEIRGPSVGWREIISTWSTTSPITSPITPVTGPPPTPSNGHATSGRVRASSEILWIRGRELPGGRDRFSGLAYTGSGSYECGARNERL